MDKSQLVITEIFISDTEKQRKDNLQNAVDQYIRLTLKNRGLYTCEAKKNSSPGGLK